MKKLLVLYVILLSTQIIYSQSILMTINKDTIYTDKFEKSQKNNLEQLGVKQAINSFIDFNLLKQYSIKKGIPNSQAYVSQLNRDQVIFKDSVYYSKEVLDPLLKDYYQKLQTERKVQLLFFKEGVLSAENAENDVNSIITKINNNTLNFEKTTEEYSSIEEYKKPEYINVFSLAKPIIDEIYKAPLNEVIKFKISEDNYCLILVTNERKYLGDVVLEEVYIKNSSEDGEKEANLVYHNIKNLEDFAKAKKKYSKNYTEKEKKNHTSIINDTLYNYLLEAKEPTIFPPVKTMDGYKIYRYIFRDEYTDYKKSKDRIYDQLKKSSTIIILNNNLIQELRQKSFFRENKENIKKFANSLPKSYSKFKKMEISKEEDLVTIGNDLKLTNRELLEQLKKLSNEQYLNISSVSEYAIYDWENKALINYYDSHFKELDRNKEAWQNLENQLLIKFALVEITKEAQNDAEGQKEFLEKETNRFTWKERIQGTLYYCLNSEVEKEVLKMLKSGKSSQDIGNYFNGKIDSEKNILLVINKGKFTRESVNLPTKGKLKKNIYTTDYKTRKLVINIDKVIKNDKMTLKELQTVYINEYIDYKINTTMQQLKREAVIHIDNSQEEYLQKKYGL